ncbi:helix-turn-helix transcriptional regulator [Pedobacter sp. L105]|uniref:helix-turn-helix domain-containing protein n=1 Tax=Pedobacter sp. L105 TaxID=1641871 RepID=UPI00131C70E3|nr:helix-turn-helix transcriptional regulator [Pedobacter sp. L105]
MKKPKITMTVIKEDKGFSAYTSIGQNFIATEGQDIDELKKGIVDAVNLTFEDKNITYTTEEIHLKPDLASFFEFYKVINAKALSERIGMNQSLLAQYINGTKKPSASQTQRILKGVRQVGRELVSIQFFL